MQSGVLLILLSMALTPLGDGLSKHLGDTQSPLFIVFIRYFVAGILALLIARFKHEPIRIVQNELPGLAFRTGLVVGAMTCLIVALSLTQLANAVGSFLTAPIVATGLAGLFFKEKLSPVKVAGSLFSLLGAFLILKPTGQFDPGIAVALAGGFLLGGFLAITAALNPTDSPISALAKQCLLGSAMLLPLALWAGCDLFLSLVLPALGLGSVTAATHFLTVAAYQRSEAGVLAPFFIST